VVSGEVVMANPKTELTKSQKLSLTRLRIISDTQYKIGERERNIVNARNERGLARTNLAKAHDHSPDKKDRDRIAVLNLKIGKLDSTINENRRIKQAGVDKLWNLDNIQKKQIRDEKISVSNLTKNQDIYPNDSNIRKQLFDARRSLATSESVGRATSQAKSRSQTFAP
jgi:hypothetical protein